MSVSWATRQHRDKHIAPYPKENTLEVGNTDDVKGLDGFSSLMTPDVRDESQIHIGTVTSSIPLQ